MDVRLNKKK